MRTRTFFSFVIIFCSMMLSATAQNKAYLVLEYMHVKPGNDAAYMQTENLWKKIHQQRQKDSTILDWGVWAVTLPYDMNAEYQYVVGTVYPSMDAFLNGYAKMDTHKIFPGLSDDDVNNLITASAGSRDMVRSTVIELLYSDGFNGKTAPTYVLATAMKATPGKESDYESLETKDWGPIHKDLIKNGFESAFSFGRLMFPADANSPYNYIIFRFFDKAAMMDKMDQADFTKYNKANPAAFTNAGTLRTEVHTELLTKVVSLTDAAK